MCAIGTATIGFLALLLGLIVFVKGKATAEKLSFAAFTLLIAGWFLPYSIMESTHDPNKALFFGRLGHSSVIFVPIAYLHFVRYFLKRPTIKPFYMFYYFIGLILLILMWMDSKFIPAVIKQPWGYYPVGSPIMVLDSALVCMTAVACTVLFVIDCRRAKDRSMEEYNRLKWCCLAMFIFTFSAMDYLPKFGVAVYPMGFVPVAIFISIMTYAILFHHLMDITIAIRRSLVYSILAAIITASYFVAVLILEKWFQGFLGYRSLVATAITGFIIAMGFVPMRNWIQTIVDRYFFRGTQQELADQNEQLLKEVERTERLKAVATLAAGMAHEIKNPLTSIKTFAEYLPEKYDDPAFREKFAKIMGQEVDKMNEMIQRLLEFAKPAPPQLGLIEVSNIIKETLDFIQGTLVKKQVQVETNFNAPDQVAADKAQLKQVFLNLLLNSVEAMDKPGRINISTSRENGHLRIDIEDNGPGIAPGDLHRIFDPFFTTKPSGTGLGLSVVHGIIRGHGGRIDIDSQVGKGTAVHIELPINGSSMNGGSHGTTAHLNS